MDIFHIFGVLGGLAIFLYGMFIMNDNVQKAAGTKLRQILLALTANRIRGFLTGLGVTSIIQSSSATTVMEVGLVGAGLMTFYQSLGVTLGAELGTTITAQLVAFRVTKYALLIVAIGFFSSFLAKTKKQKDISYAILGFGVLFLGMDIMSKSLSPLRTYEPFLRLMTTIEKPILGILFGLGFTSIIQSSSATSGIVVAMAMTGTLTLRQAIPLNLGASIGTCITALLGSLALNRDAKRAALAHYLFQIIGVCIVLIVMLIPFQGENLWLWFVKWFTRTITGTDDLAKQVAMAHTLMPLVKAPLILVFLKPISNFLIRIYPSKEEEKPFGPIYISDTLITTPGIALNQARREILRQGQIVQEMFTTSLDCFNKSDRSFVLCENVSLSDIKVDILRNAIVEYLRKVAQQNLTDKEAKHEVALLYITNDIEEIGDIIDKNIIPIAKKTIELNLMFSKEGWDEIRSLHERVMRNLSEVLEAFEKQDLVLAEKITLTKPEIGKYESQLRMHHVERLHRGLPESMETSAMHFDLLDQYKRINSHITSIAYAIKGEL